MFSLIEMLVVATTTFIAGGLLSLILTRSLSPSEKKSRTLETRLQETEEKLTSYQQEVTDHFAQTAQLVNNLTQNYKEVHEHLAGSALKLANIDISRQLLSHGVNNDEVTLEKAEEAFQPPKDWAPSDGTLSEEYGLDSTEEELTATIETAQTKTH